MARSAGRDMSLTPSSRPPGGKTSLGFLYRVVTDPLKGIKIQFSSILGPLTSTRLPRGPDQTVSSADVDMSTHFLRPRTMDPSISEFQLSSRVRIDSTSQQTRRLVLVNAEAQHRRRRGRFFPPPRRAQG